MDEPESLICAFALDGKGGGRALDWDGIAGAEAEGALLWVHLHREAPETRRWLESDSGISPLLIDALLADESRPRFTSFPDGQLLDLRGVNLNPGEDPEDMVSIRVLFAKNRILSVRRRKLLAVDELRQRVTGQSGPADIESFLVILADGLVTRMARVIETLNERVDELEERVLESQSADLRRNLHDVRREAIALRRYIGPNREALSDILSSASPWLHDTGRQRLRETSDRITRSLEEIDTARERAAVINDELASRLSESINRNMYVLALIAGIFLPLSLLTGLLGINVAGIPGEKWEWAFASVCALLFGLAGVELWLLKRLRWL